MPTPAGQPARAQAIVGADLPLAHEDHLWQIIFRDEWEYDPSGCHTSTKALEHIYLPRFPEACKAAFKRPGGGDGTATLASGLGQGQAGGLVPAIGKALPGSPPLKLESVTEKYTGGGTETTRTICRLNIKPQAQFHYLAGVESPEWYRQPTSIVICMPFHHRKQKSEAEKAQAARAVYEQACKNLLAHALCKRINQIDFVAKLAHGRKMEEMAEFEDNMRTWKNSTFNYTTIPVTAPQTLLNGYQPMQTSLPTLLETPVPVETKMLYVFPALQLCPWNLRTLACFAKYSTDQTGRGGKTSFWGFGVNGDPKAATWDITHSDFSQLVLVSFRDLRRIWDGFGSDKNAEWTVEKMIDPAVDVKEIDAKKITAIHKYLMDPARDGNKLKNLANAFGTQPNWIPGHSGRLPLRT